MSNGHRLIDFERGALGNICDEPGAELGHVVGEKHGVVASAGDGDVAKPRIEQVRVNAGVGVDQDALGGESLGAVAGYGIPVKRVCMAVNPVSNGDCARASAGKRITRVKRLRLGRIRRRLPLRAACNRRVGVRAAIIGTSNGLNFCRSVSEGSPRIPVCPRLLVYAAIVFIYGCPRQSEQNPAIHGSPADSVEAMGCLMRFAGQSRGTRKRRG